MATHLTLKMKAQVETFIKDTTKEMQDYAKQKYGIDDFNVEIGVKWNRSRSWGGTRNGGHPFMELAPAHFIPNELDLTTPVNFNEYPSFAFDKFIGSVQNVSWTTALKILVAHEISHAIQYSNTNRVCDVLFGSFLDRKETHGHKRLWKNIYKDMRNQFVNPFIGKVKEKVVPFVQKPIETTPVDVETKKETPITTTSKKKWKVNKYCAFGGTVIEYLNSATNAIILTVLKRANHNIFILDKTINKWVDSGTTSRVEIRNRAIALM